MGRLRIDWRTLNTVAPQAAATGTATADANAQTALRSEKPMMIYVQHDDETDMTVRKLEDVVFIDERVALGAKFFDTIKVEPGNALQDRILKEAGKGTPRLIFLKRDYSGANGLRGKQISGSKVLKAMSFVARKEYVTSFAKMVRSYRKLLNDVDRLEGKKATIAQSRARLQGKPNPSKAKKLAREEKKLAAEFKKLEEQENKLLAFRSKGAKPTT